MKLIISNAPRTKKNHGHVVRVRGRQFHMPSKAWQKWCDDAKITIPDYRMPHWGWNGIGPDVLLPDQALNCAAVFYRDARRGDAVGYYQGLADLLEKRHIVTNDSQIVSWNGSRMELDSANPRTEIELSEVGV